MYKQPKSVRPLHPVSTKRMFLLERLHRKFVFSLSKTRHRGVKLFPKVRRKNGEHKEILLGDNPGKLLFSVF